MWARAREPPARYDPPPAKFAIIPSDMTDEEWGTGRNTADFPPGHSNPGWQKRKGGSWREVLVETGVMYISRLGCQWARDPKDLAPPKKLRCHDITSICGKYERNIGAKKPPTRLY